MAIISNTVNTSTIRPIGRAIGSGVNQQALATSLASQIVADLQTATVAPTTGLVSTPVTPSTTPAATGTTDNPFMDWLGLSSTPVTPMIAGVPNWILVAGAGALVLMMASERG